MPDLAFGLGAYSRGDDRLPRVRLINLFAEQTPTSKTGVALIQRPGLAPLHTLTGDCRGFYRQAGVLDGSLFSVFGATLYQDGVSVGAIATGTDLVELAYTVDGLRFLSGGVIYATDGAAITADVFPDSALVASLAEINGILVAVRADNGAVYFRLPGTAAWDGLNFFFGEREADPAVAVRRTGDELWVFGSTSIEPFATTGDAEIPFVRIDGRAIQRGCKDRDSISTLDNSILWVGEDNIVYRGDGVPIRVSNHGIEERIERSTVASSWTYTLAGHAFYVLNLLDETLAYDVATGEWHQLKLFGQDTFVQTGFFSGSVTYVGKNGGAFTLGNVATDNGDQIERIFTSIAPASKPYSVNALQISVSPGTSALGVTSVVETRWSNDQGRTWCDWRPASLGTEGEYRTRCRIRKLGQIDEPGRVFEHRITDPAIVRFSGVELNPPMGGRSR